MFTEENLTVTGSRHHLFTEYQAQSLGLRTNYASEFSDQQHEAAATRPLAHGRMGRF